MALLFLIFFKIFFCPFLSTFQRYMIEKSINGGSMKRIEQPLEAGKENNISNLIQFNKERWMKPLTNMKIGSF